MERLTIALDDEQMRLLRAYAERRGQTPDEAVVALLGTVLCSAGATPAASAPALTSALGLSGLVNDPTIVPLSAQDMDRLLAAEALNSHDDQ